MITPIGWRKKGPTGGLRYADTELVCLGVQRSMGHFGASQSSARGLPDNRQPGRFPGPHSTEERSLNVPAKFRIVIIGRDRMSGELLASALNQTCSCEAVAVGSEQLLETLGVRKAHLAVISAELGASRNGFDLTSAALRACPELAIVVLLAKPSSSDVVNAFRAGARGVFSRERAIQELLDCIEHVRKGFLWIGPEEADGLLHVLRNLPMPNLVMAGDAPALTDRELQVVQCAATGKTNRAIAQELHLSENTVKNYLFRIFEKLGASSRVELLFYLTLRGTPSEPAGGKR